MKTTILTIIAILLAIPTFGISIVVWIFMKYKYDKWAANSVLINAIVMSYDRGGEPQIRYGINNAALAMVYDLYGGKMLDNSGSKVAGIIPHPMKKNEMMLAVMEQMSDNKLHIVAIEPRD